MTYHFIGPDGPIYTNQKANIKKLRQWSDLSLPSSSGLSRDSGIDSGITNGGCFVVLAATVVQTAAVAVGKESFELIEHDLSEFVAWLLLMAGG